MVNPKARKTEPPFQLYGDLHCSRLRPLHPVSDAIVEVKEKEDKARLGIVPLSECRRED